LIKLRYYIPCHATDGSEELARLFIKYVVIHHSLPETIISDQGAQFISRFWQHVTTRWKTKTRLSTAYHPEIDRQTERLNTTLK